MNKIKIKLNQKRYEKPLEEFVSKILKRFNDEVVSIILFGSVARSAATEYSDIDLLIITERENREEFDTEVLSCLLKYGVRIFPITCSKEEIEFSVAHGNPLFYGILTGYKLIYDKEEFFVENFRKVAERVKKEKPIFISGGEKWELAKMIKI